MYLHSINTYKPHTYGSHCASDLAIVCRNLALQASFNVCSFSDQILLSIKEKNNKKFPAPRPTNQMSIPTDLCRPSIEAKHQSLFLHKLSWPRIQISRGREFPFSYKQRSPALQFLLETSVMANLLSDYFPKLGWNS